MNDEERYGFRWRQTVVTRIAEIDGRIILGIETDAGRKLQIYVSPGGRSVRVFENNKEWSK